MNHLKKGRLSTDQKTLKTHQAEDYEYGFSTSREILIANISRTSNSLEKVLVVCSSMTCFTNCFTVSGS